MRVRPVTRRLQRIRKNVAAPYVGAVAIRTAGRAIWGIAVPAALSVGAYGRYQIIATAAAMAAQVALLGTPQTIVRYAGRSLPTRLIAAHVLVLGVVAIALGVILVPTLRPSGAAVVLASLVLATIASTLLGARARARFAFARSCVAEAAGAAVLILAALSVITGMYRGALSARTALVIEAVALAVTAAALLQRPASPIEPSLGATTPARRPVFANIYTVGALVLLDIVLFRRVEVYFLERSPDGLTGVAVLGLSLQVAAVALLVPTALLEAWQPRFAILASGSDRFLQREVARRGRQFAGIMVAVTATGVVVPVVAVPFLFPAYRAWLGYIVAFVAIRLACGIAGFYSSVLYAVGGHRALFVPGTISVVVALAANAALTARFGLRGALVAYAMTQVTLAVLTVVAFRRAMPEERAVPQPDAVAA